MENRNRRNRRGRNRGYPEDFLYSVKFYSGVNPVRIFFKLIWIFFFFLIVLSLVMAVLSFVFGVSIIWLGSAWSAWGGLWVVFIIIFIFFGPWWGGAWKHGFDSTEMAMRRAKMRLARGEITVKQYREIVNELKKK